MVTSLSLFEVLSRGLFVVAGSSESGLVVTWNGSLTLSAWTVGESGMLSEVNVRTLQEAPSSPDEAFRRAQVWLDRL